MSAIVTGSAGFFRRYAYAAACVGLALLLSAGAWWLQREIADLRLVHADRAKQGEAMLSTLVGGSTTRQELSDIREATRRIDENLVVESNLAENLWYFYKLEEQTRVKLPELNQMGSPSTDKSPLYRRVPYNLKVTGSFEQVAAFLQALETGPRLVKIRSFTFGREGAGGLELGLDLSIDVLGKR